MVRSLTVPEYASIVGKTPRTIYARIKAGTVKSFKVGGVGYAMIPETEVPAMLRVVDDRQTRADLRRRAKQARAKVLA